MKLRFPAVIALSFGLSVFYAVGQSWEKFLVFSTDVLFAIVSGGCSLLALLVVLKAGSSGKLGMVHLGLFLAVFLWFLGELTWGFYEVVLNILIPYPSVADLFYAVGYIPAALAIVQFLWVFRELFTGMKYTINLLFGLFIIGPTYVFLLNPLMMTPAPFLTKVFDMAYPVLDAILLILTIMMFILFEGRFIAKPWLWISLGILLTAMADISFAFGTLAGWYYSGHPIELFWLWGYISMGLGFAEQAKSGIEVQPN